MCHICAEPIFAQFTSPHPYSYTVDHVIPTVKGGPDLPANRRPAHRRCNLRKGDTLPPPEVVRAVLAAVAAEARPILRMAKARRLRRATRIALPPEPGSLPDLLRSI